MEKEINKKENLGLKRRVPSNPQYFDESKGLLKLRELCERDLGDIVNQIEKTKSNPKKHNSVYCKLYQLKNNLNDYLGERLIKDVSDIYSNLRPGILDNRTKFHKLIDILMEHDTPANSINMIADFIRKAKDSDETEKMLNSLRRDPSLSNTKKIEEFLEQIKYSVYTQYEKSFVGDYFDRNTTFLKLEYRSKQDEKDLVSLIIDIINKETTTKKVINDLYNVIRGNYNPDNMNKGDLICKVPLKDNLGNIIINVGDLVEVKKMDHQADSYLSEFLAIYKNKNLPDICKTNRFLKIYNDIIDGLYKNLAVNGSDILQDVTDRFAGIMYDKNQFIEKKHIELYWSNKGMYNCKQKRLAIRYRIKGTTITGYEFNTTSGELIPKKLELRMPSDKFICEI
jgi:hypothetical protein